MEDAELKTSVDIISLIDNSNVSMSSISEAEVSESKHGCTTAEMKEISALISFKGGFICSLGSGRAVVVDTIINKDSDEDVKLKISQLIRLPLRNANTAGTWTSAQTASGLTLIL